MIKITSELLDSLISKSESAAARVSAPRKSAKKITVEQAQSIFETRRPFGKFYFCQHGKYIGVDNTSGDVLTDVFSLLDECLEWLDR